MLNAYLLEKRLQEWNKANHKMSLEKTWNDWRYQHSSRWINNYRKRVERFIVDV